MTLTEYKSLEREISKKASQASYRKSKGASTTKLEDELAKLRAKRDKAVADAERQLKN